MKTGYGNGGDHAGTKVVPFTGFSSCLDTGVELRRIRGLLTQLECMVGEVAARPPDYYYQQPVICVCARIPALWTLNRVPRRSMAACLRGNTHSEEPVEIRVTRTIADVGARRRNESSPVSKSAAGGSMRIHVHTAPAGFTPTRHGFFCTVVRSFLSVASGKKLASKRPFNDNDRPDPESGMGSL